MEFTITNVIAVYLRHIFDAFAIFGFGLFIMGRKEKISGLVKIAIFTAVFITPVRFAPIPLGAQVYIIYLIMIMTLLYMKKNMSVMKSASVVLLAGWILVVLKWISSTIFFSLGVNLAESGSFNAVIYSLPSTIVLLITALVLQIYFSPIKFGINDSDNEGYKIEITEVISVAQLFTTFLVFTTIATTDIYKNFSDWFIRFVPIVIFSLIIIFYFLHKKNNFIKNNFFKMTAFIDIVTLIPLIYLILALSGGADSIYKFLFIPLIITNTLKSDKIHGFISVLFSCLVLLILGMQSSYWNISHDLIYIANYLFVYLVIKYFLDMENSLKDKIYIQAYTDELTGLYNRRYLHKELKANIKDRYIIMVDLDNFEIVNDKLGNLVGNRLLTRIGTQLKVITRDNDIVVRYGGDEFTILPGGYINKEKIMVLADRISNSIKKTSADFLYQYSNKIEFEHITASIGISQKREKDNENLIQKADKALHKAKKYGSNSVYFEK
ncbi:MAG: GGDEF domain-containing protein [Halothermotrichaceae bacterium]